MSNQSSLNLLYQTPARWLQSRLLTIAGDPLAGHAMTGYVFGSVAQAAPDPTAATSAAKRGHRVTPGHIKGRAARSLVPAISGGMAMLADPVAEQMGNIPMQYSTAINFSQPLPLGPLATFAAGRFAATGKLSGCCIVWDKPNGLIGHIKPAGVSGAALRAGLAATGFTLFGVETTGVVGSGEYTGFEAVNVIGVNAGGWNVYAQVADAMTGHILRVVTL